MKKLLAFILTSILVISSSACSSSSVEDIKEPSSVAVISSNQNTEQEEVTDTTEVTITETVLVDEAGIKITAKGLEKDEFFGPQIKLLIENNSGKDLTFQCRNSSVNGYMVGTMMSVDVVNGKKTNDTLTFMDSDLEKCGIETIADMTFSFHVFDMNEWETYLDTAPIQIKTSAYDTYNYIYDDSGSLAYDGNGIKVVVKGLDNNDSFFGPSVVVYIENNSNNDITVQARNISVNEFMVDAIFSSDVTTGKRAIDTITFMESDLEANEITTIEDIELSFHIFDLNSWDTIVDTEIINISF